MRFEFGCELDYDVAAPTAFVFCIEAAQIDAHLALRGALTFEPALDVTASTVPPFGNRYARVVAPPGHLRVSYKGSLDLKVARANPDELQEIPIGGLPLELFSYIQPSRFCEADRLTEFAELQFGGIAPGFNRVSSICNWICENVAYQRHSTDSLTSAAQVLDRRVGVCRDFAHLGIALTRALGIPARFVSCYALGLSPDDFHAVFEAYLGGRWWLFDATRQAALDGMIRIGIGRDAAEVSFASIYGDATPAAMSVFITAEDPAASGRPRTVDAISTA